MKNYRICTAQGGYVLEEWSAEDRLISRTIHYTFPSLVRALMPAETEKSDMLNIVASYKKVLEDKGVKLDGY